MLARTVNTEDSIYREVVRHAVWRARRGGPRPLAEASVADICDRLLGLDGAKLKLYVRSSQAASRPEVVRALIRRSFELRTADPRQGITIARLAVRLARQGGRFGPRKALASDALAEAAANLSRFLRIIERYELSDLALGAAERARLAGTLDPLVLGFVLRSRAALRRDQQRFAEAIDAATEAEELYQRIGDARNVAIAQTLRGLAEVYSGQATEARATFLRTLEPIHHLGDQKLAFMTLHNLIYTFEALGLHAWAHQEMERARAFYGAHSAPKFDLAAAALRGRLQCANGELTKARKSLEAAKAGFMARGLHYDAALAGLDLGLVYAELGEVRQLAELSREMWHVFTAKKIPREAAATLLLFADTARRWQAKPEFIRGLLAELAPVRRATGR